MSDTTLLKGSTASTEKSKMLAGHYYQAWDEKLTNERNRAKQLCHQFNQLPPDQGQQKQLILKKLFGYHHQLPY